MSQEQVRFLLKAEMQENGSLFRYSLAAFSKSERLRCV
jgi:hypothetical protein